MLGIVVVAVAGEAERRAVATDPGAAARAAGHVAGDLDRVGAVSGRRGVAARERRATAVEPLPVEVDSRRDREWVGKRRIAECRVVLLPGAIEAQRAAADDVLDPAPVLVAADHRDAGVEAQVGRRSPSVGREQPLGEPLAVGRLPAAVSGHEHPGGGEAGAELGVVDAVPRGQHRGMRIGADRGRRADEVARLTTALVVNEDLAVDTTGPEAGAAGVLGVVAGGGRGVGGCDRSRHAPVGRDHEVGGPGRAHAGGGPVSGGGGGRVSNGAARNRGVGLCGWDGPGQRREQRERDDRRRRVTFAPHTGHNDNRRRSAPFIDSHLPEPSARRAAISSSALTLAASLTGRPSRERFAATQR